jgi:ABC-type multidrug transport system ATPase subunit
MIKVENLSFSYQGAPVIDRLSLEIQSPGMTLLTGANGRGKTTLLKLLAGVLQPTSGAIAYSDQKRPHELRSVAPQKRSFDLAFTVEEILAIVKIRSHLRDEIIERLELTPLLASKVTELSLGQQQRVSVALALIQESDFYLLDEPFSAQDSHFESALLSLLRDIAKRKGVLVISHHAENMHSLFDYSITL